jgi:heterodisulfide reductase subunit C
MNGDLPLPTIRLPGQKTGFDTGSEVTRRSGVDFNSCLHCRCCASGCPFVDAMDYHPHGVIRLLQFKQTEQALSCATIWLCVGCHTCSMACPMAIDIAAIMDALRQIALERQVPVAEPGILGFHREVLNTVARYGRTHKLEIMLRYKVRTRDWFSDMDVGLKMLAKRKLDLMPSRVKNIAQIKHLFNGLWEGRSHAD